MPVGTLETASVYFKNIPFNHIFIYYNLYTDLGINID